MGRWARAERSPEPSSPAKKTVLNLTDQAELTRLRRENEQSALLKYSANTRNENQLTKNFAGSFIGEQAVLTCKQYVHLGGSSLARSIFFYQPL
jgi:hypothetical protein